ncbi:MAG: hypothetical protein ACXQTI_02215 [Candidatus Nezhaarchaeales archaeon]
MISVKIGEQRVYLPDPKTVLFSKFIGWLEFIDEHEPSWWNELDLEEEGGVLEQLTDGQRLELFDYAAKELAFWSSVSYKEWRKADLNDLFGVWAWYRGQYSYSYVEDWNCLEIDNKIYYLPERFMSESTLEDYAESNEYEKQLINTLNGQYLAVFGIAAVILRLKDEEGRLESFDDYEEDWRVAHFKDHLTAMQAHQIAFFLQRRRNTLLIDSQIFTTAQILAQQKQDMSN